MANRGPHPMAGMTHAVIGPPVERVSASDFRRIPHKTIEQAWGLLSPLRLPFRQAGTGSEIRRFCRFPGVPRAGKAGIM